jgi:hypothetical protein
VPVVEITVTPFASCDDLVSASVIGAGVPVGTPGNTSARLVAVAETVLNDLALARDTRAIDCIASIR